MKFIDAHIHLSDTEYADCVDKIVADSRASSVVALVSNSMNLKTSVENLRIGDKHHGMVFAAIGIHPWNVQTLTDNELEQTLEFAAAQRQSKALVAIGEIGLDSKYMNIWERQMMVFTKMLQLAERLDLPVTIHSRGTTTQIVDMLPSFKIKRILLHWFSNPSSLAKAMDNGYYVSEGAPTIYSHGIREIVRKAPLTNLMTETDGPVHFFKPPFKGKMTTPSFVPVIVEKIAEIKKLDVADAARQILENFESFFSVKLN